MKKLLSIFLFFSIFIYFSCNKDDSNICVEGINLSIEDSNLGDVSFTLPNGEYHEGYGLKPTSLSFGDYQGSIQSVNISEVVDTQNAQLFLNIIHFFDDDQGNSFWTNEDIVFTNTGQIAVASSSFNFNVIDGRGDFECPEGQISCTAIANFFEDKMDFTITGKICGGCE